LLLSLSIWPYFFKYFQEEFKAVFNKLTGSLPSKIGLTMKLTELGLFDNMLTGKIPTEIG
jgi:hypothetical protein